MVLALPGQSGALTISADADTGDCFGSGSDCVGGLYTLTVSQVGGTTYRATLTMDFGSTNPLYDLDVQRDYIKEIELKVANVYFQPIVVTAAPGGNTANWLPVDGPLNGNGCGGSNDGFICLDAVSDLVMGSTKTFTWSVDFELQSSSQLLPESSWHIGARFGRINPSNGREQTSLLSAQMGAAPIPEPTSALLFGGGMLIVGAAARRRID